MRRESSYPSSQIKDFHFLSLKLTIPDLRLSINETFQNSRHFSSYFHHLQKNQPVRTNLLFCDLLRCKKLWSLIFLVSVPPLFSPCSASPILRKAAISTFLFFTSPVHLLLDEMFPLNAYQSLLCACGTPQDLSIVFGLLKQQSLTLQMSNKMAVIVSCLL